ICYDDLLYLLYFPTRRSSDLFDFTEISLCFPWFYGILKERGIREELHPMDNRTDRQKYLRLLALQYPNVRAGADIFDGRCGCPGSEDHTSELEQRFVIVCILL